MRDTPIIFLSNQIYNGAGNVAQLSTSIGGVFSTQQSTITTSNAFVNRGYIRLSNAFGDATYIGQGLQLCNTGISVNSDQFAALKIVNPTGTIAEATFDTTAAGGPLLALGAGTASRGAYFFVGGDAININQSNQAVSIANGGTAQSNFKLLVNGNSAFVSSMTLSNGDFSMSNVRTQKADLISTGLNLYNGNMLISTTGAVAGSATFNKTNIFLNAGNFTQSNTAAVPGTVTYYNTALTVTGGTAIFNSTVTVNANLTVNGATAQTANFFSTSMAVYGNQTIFGTIENRGDTTTYIADKSSTSLTYGISSIVNFSNFSGMIIINNTNTTGVVALWLCGGGATLQLGASGVSGGTGTVLHNSGISGYTWTNNTGGSITATLTAIRTRAEA